MVQRVGAVGPESRGTSHHTSRLIEVHDVDGVHIGASQTIC